MRRIVPGAVVVLSLGLCAQQARAADDLFISEYIEGSSNNKALEIHNATGAGVDLSAYQIEMYFNGSASPGRTIALSGTVADGDVFVLAHSSADPAILNQADMLAGGSFYNGNDAIVLVHDGVVVDAIGQVGVDPGSQWGSGDLSTGDNTLRRQAGVCDGDTDGSDAFDPALQWDGFPQDTFDDLGSHAGDCDGGGGGGGDLFFSEYIEGSSNNKALELHNPTGAGVDLSAYQIEVYSNGSASPGQTIALSGTVADGDVFVLAHGSAAPEILAQADQLADSGLYNGDDAIVLVHDGVVIDAIGQVGVDPGSQWGSGDLSTQDNTLRRQDGACSGDTDPADAFDPALQWDGFPQDTFGDLGSHSGCGDGGGGGGGELVLIHEVQGSGASSPLAGTEVIVEAIVVADFQGESQLSGIFVQEEDADADSDPATSEGIFVYNGGAAMACAVGDLVRVTGTVQEHFQLTELAGVTVEVLSSGQALPTATDVFLPFLASDEPERFEGMRVRLPQELAVTENFNLGRFGEVWLSSGGRLMQPTAVAEPGPDALAVQAANDLNRILLDDSITIQNPDPIVYPAPELTAANTLRSGDAITGLTGVLDFAFDTYRIQPTETPAFSPANPRTAAPDDVGGSLRVASFNVLNYFNGDGQGGGFPTSRGANTLEELVRQHDKIVAAITAMDADIIGLMEIENDGYGGNSAIQDLVDGLNAVAPPGTSYGVIDPGLPQIGTDEITVGIIYRLETVTPVGSAAILDASVDPRFDDTKNRPTLAQTFEEIATGGRVTVAVNHLKSKGSSCDSIGDPDTGDGQGNCNLTRTSAAEAMVDWLATDPTGGGTGNVLIIGDLNAYAQEDPIDAVESGGYADLIDAFIGAANTYSYVFQGQSGYLDHALASSALMDHVTGVTEWHINTDEPRALDYNVEFKSPGQVASLYSDDAYRASDHDPVLVGLSLGAQSQTVSVVDIDAYGVSMLGDWLAVTIVRVADAQGQPVAGVVVEGLWAGSGQGASTCTTNANGRCLVSAPVEADVTTASYQVADLIHETAAYDPAGNGDPDGDSDGTQIIVTRPE